MTKIPSLILFKEIGAPQSMSKWNRPIIDADLASTPSLGAEETLQAGVDVISTDVYGTQNSFKAVVLSPPIPRLITDVAALGYGASPAAETPGAPSLKPVFMFRGRILDGAVPSPHAPLVDPCKISTAGDPNAALNAVVLHTMFYSAQNYAGDIPNVGDIVNVRLSPGDAKYNLQHGAFIDVDITAGRMLTAQIERECASLSTLFGGEIGMIGDSPVLTPASLDFERDLQRLVEAAGLPFFVTDRARSVDIQVQRIKSMYSQLGESELIANYGVTRGAMMARAIESGDNNALFEAARGSSSHLRGAGLDIRSSHYDTNGAPQPPLASQINQVLAIIRNLGGSINLEPSSTDCWSVKGTAVRPAGTATHRKPGASPSSAICKNEHIHITIPADYDSNTAV